MSKTEESANLPRDVILDDAKRIINGDRAEEYGGAFESFSRIAALWSVLIDTELSAVDVARMMIAMKLARLTETSQHTDSWIDIAGYAALGYEVAREQ